MSGPLHARLRALAAAAAMLVLAGGRVALAQAQPPELADDIDEAAVLVEKETLSVADWARLSYLAARVFRYGPAAVPDMQRHFESAATPEKAFLTGLYVASYGGNVEHLALRGRLEQDPRKRAWMTRLAGSGPALVEALAAGESWRRATALLPSPRGCRAFVGCLMQSRDPLVRRGGMLWGYWFADPLYWRRVALASTDDPDALTRRFALHLLRRAAV